MLKPDHLTQKQIDGFNTLGRDLCLMGQFERLHIKLSKYALQTNNLIPRVFPERISHAHMEQVRVAKQLMGNGYDLVGTTYQRACQVTKPKPTMLRKALHKLQLIEIV